MTYLDEHIRDIVVTDARVLEFPKLTGDSIVNNVIESFIERSNVGFAKYGTNLDRKDLSFLDWINHLQMELQDAILYAEKLKQEHNG
jgi:cell division protein FtsI/penicillin-binding protein 2